MRNETSTIYFRKQFQDQLAIGLSFLSTEQREQLLKYLSSFIHDGKILNCSQELDISSAFHTYSILKALVGSEKYEQEMLATLKSFDDPSRLDIQSLEVLSASWNLIESQSPDTFLASEIIEKLDGIRCADMGWSHVAKSHCSSTFGTWLAFACFQNLESPIQDELKAIPALNKLKATDGAYSHDIDAEHGSIPSTYFAISLLLAMDEEPDHTLVNWIVQQQADDGGFLAARIMPFGDISSTSYALTALKSLNADIANLRPNIKQFLFDLMPGDGGFSAHCRQAESDIISTYYGLIALGQLEE